MPSETLTIITQPHRTLRQRATEVQPSEIKKLVGFFRAMEQTMQQHDGLGLAANQVDVLKRVIIISTTDGPLAIINPKLSKKSFKKEEAEEGCLSIPGVYGLVKRHARLVVDGYNKSGKRFSMKASGLFARVIQHEVDHLDGILFTDRTKKITRGIPPHEPKTL